MVRQGTSLRSATRPGPEPRASTAAEAPGKARGRWKRNLQFRFRLAVPAHGCWGPADCQGTSLRCKTYGKVYLVGAGPGDPSLLTLRAREILEQCDVVVHDALVPAEILDYALTAERICVGKRGGEIKAPSQASINQVLGKLARQGKKVARVKGGDPLIFGRGGEEALYLSRQRIPFEIVPGVTAALGAAAFVGIPLTHRGLASQVTLVTAQEDSKKGKSAIPWKAMVESRGTLVFYMGMASFEGLVQKLLQYGHSRRTPVAVVEWATTPHQKVVDGSLQDISRKIKRAGIIAPAVVIVGRVVGLRKRTDWFGGAPLHGRKVLVTRARHQSGSLKRELERLGAWVVEFPTVEISPPERWDQIDAVIPQLSEYNWIVFTSANGVEYFMQRLYSKGRDARAFAAGKIGAIGPATAEKLRGYGIIPDLIPSEYVGESLISSLAGREELSGKKILLLRSNLARPYLMEELATRGALVRELTAYRTVRVRRDGRKLAKSLQSGAIDFVTFTSSSTVEGFASCIGKENLSGLKGKTRWISIGPVTTKTAQDHGIPINREAKEYTLPGLVTALVEEASR